MRTVDSRKHRGRGPETGPSNSSNASNGSFGRFVALSGRVDADAACGRGRETGHQIHQMRQMHRRAAPSICEHPKPPTDQVDERPQARRQSTLNGRSHKINEQNLVDVPNEITPSPQFGAKRLGQAILAMRGPGCAAFGRCARRGVRNIGRAHLQNQKHARCVICGDSVWLCSTHPKPTPTTFRGWLAPIRQGGCDSAEIVLKT